MPSHLLGNVSQQLSDLFPRFVVGGEEPTLSFPRGLASYGDESLASLVDVLLHRISIEPLNLIATAIFFLAVIHTFCAPLFLRVAKVREEREHLLWLESEGYDPSREAPLNFLTVALRYLGEIEAVFGLWAIPLIAIVSLVEGWGETKRYIESSVQFSEAVFVVVIMAIAGTQPLLFVAERTLARVARFFGGSPAAWWSTILVLGPLLGSLITEPAAMTICALLLGHHFYRYKPSTRLAYATVGLLFSNISVGGLMTNFAAPAVVLGLLPPRQSPKEARPFSASPVSV